MAQNQVTVEQFKIRLTIWRDAIPIYEGGTKLLSHFLQTCDKFVENLVTSEEALNTALFALIKSRIRGEALNLIVANNPETWNECKILLINRYSDPSSEDLLFNKLSSCYQLSNQNYEKYADEIKNRLNKLKEHIHLNSQDRNLITMKITFYENVAKNTFINGIKEPYHTHLTHFELADIEACLIKCRKLDNHEQQAACLNFARQRETKTKANNTNSNLKTTNLFTNQTPRNNSSFNTFGANKNPFPFTPRPATAQNNSAPTFANNFGRSTQQNHQPTPMSVNTRNTNRSNNNQGNRSNNFASQSRFFKSTGPPNFVSEELHYQEEQSEEVAYNEDQEDITGDDNNYENQENTDAENFQPDPNSVTET